MRAIMEIIDMKIVYHSPQRMQKSPPSLGGIRGGIVTIHSVFNPLIHH